jgi:hypothetical protein
MLESWLFGRTQKYFKFRVEFITVLPQNYKDKISGGDRIRNMEVK